MSLNCQGLANPSNKLTIKRSIESLKPSIILLREIMSIGEKTIQELSKLLSGWDFSFIDVIGMFGENIIDSGGAPSL